MRFRQNEFLFWEGHSCLFICLVVCIGLMVYDKIFIPTVLIALIPLLFALIILVTRDEEFVTMDEDGITCQRKSTVLWEFKWSEIQELRTLLILRRPSIQIVPTADYWKTHSIINAPDPYFQLSAKAKKALQLYCKCQITRTK